MSIKTVSVESATGFTARDIRDFVRLLPDYAIVNMSKREDRGLGYNASTVTVTKLHATWDLYTENNL